MPMLSLSDRPLHTDPAIGTVPIVIRSCAKVTVVTVDTPSLQEPSSAALADRLIALADGDGAGCERQAVSLERVEEAGVDALNALLRAHLALSVLGGGLVVFGAPRTLSTAIEAAGSRVCCSKRRASAPRSRC